ncbi:hypothetical protein HYH03_018739 [Edaphochlamys debaryana]|uniref:NADPH:adrenodoxin oxidoreductase, mitochondrial n=1 Tax=Edaphochlamys debaryana TaxID=47281 RepID=A0A835XJN4_9CHLO|nr:hypothetical protein HYH03_018739 [Edaphochlamys debaryana]|eukprot:KAG2482330.1 hypothetical protein HYH03_018739 [Edaphochlamys debaryana]
MATAGPALQAVSGLLFAGVRRSSGGLLLQTARSCGLALGRSFATDAADSGKLHVCVVGAGPAGFYTIDKLLKRYGDKVHVTLVDRLPTPFGLVRSGVAPDHQDTKNVTNQFSGLAADPRVTFLGHVRVGAGPGADVSLGELRERHHAVVLSYGAESDRRLGIPGEDGPGVLSARELVWWYNGHPDMRDLPIDLTQVRSVAICGIGNVALDCARALLAPAARFGPTDLAAHALQQLQASGGGREVHLVARRGPVQAACTPKELKELLTECGVAARVAAPEQLSVSAADAAEMKATRIKRRVHELVSKGVADSKGVPSGGEARELYFQFYRSPVEVLRGGPGGSVSGLKVEVTEVRPEGPGGAPVAVGSGRFETLPCQLVLKSIGYRGLPMEGVPFDAKKGVVPNEAGRVLQAVPAAGAAPPAPEPGLYVVGWLKRGPTGIIGTNLVDAEDTAASVIADTDALLTAGRGRAWPQGPAGAPGLAALLGGRGAAAVGWGGWRRLDEAEVAAGKAGGRAREKVTRVPEMLRIAGVA